MTVLRRVNFPWYDLPETAHLLDELYVHLRTFLTEMGFKDIGSRLSRNEYRYEWQCPDLLLSQACGWDLVCDPSISLQAVCTPLFNLPGNRAGQYFSYVLVRAKSPFEKLVDLKSTRAAINSKRSHSGMSAFRKPLADLGQGDNFFSEVLVSGSHDQSLNLLCQNEVDVICIDAVTYHLIQDLNPKRLESVRILHTTDGAAAPPYVTLSSYDAKSVHQLRCALEHCFKSPVARKIFERLRIEGFSDYRPEEYNQIKELNDRYQEFKLSANVTGASKPTNAPRPTQAWPPAPLSHQVDGGLAQQYQPAH